MTRSLFATAIAFSIAAVPAWANLVTNPSFETGDFTGWEQVNDTSFSGVGETFGGIVPPDGTFQAFFGPVDTAGGGILQNISTTPGQTYELSFQLANLGNPPNAFGLFWDGAFQFIEFDLEQFDYLTVTETLTASTNNTSLGFIFYHEPSFFLLDDIVLVAADVDAPTPATLGLLFAGLALVAVARRR